MRPLGLYSPDGIGHQVRGGAQAPLTVSRETLGYLCSVYEIFSAEGGVVSGYAFFLFFFEACWRQTHVPKINYHSIL